MLFAHNGHATLNRGHMGIWLGRLRTHMERQAFDANTQIPGQSQQLGRLFRRATEFTRQIHFRIGTAKTHTQNQTNAVTKAAKLQQLVPVIHHKGGATEAQRIVNITARFDRVRVNTGARIDMQLAQHFNFAACGHIKTGAQCIQCSYDIGVGKTLNRIIKPYLRQGLLQVSVLLTHNLTIQRQHRSTMGFRDFADGTVRQKAAA